MSWRLRQHGTFSRVKTVFAVVLFALSVGCDVSHGDVCVDVGEPLRAPVLPSLPLAMRYQPLAVGARWTYNASNSVETTQEIITVGAIEAFDPLQPDWLAFRLVNRRAYGASQVVWWEDRGDQIVRHRERAIDGNGDAYGDERFLPGRLLVDDVSKHTTLGAAWKHHFSDVITDGGGTFSDCKSDAFAIEAIDETVTVPAGTFSALRVARTDSGTTTWYARGVGKIKHVGATTHDELVSYSFPAP